MSVTLNTIFMVVGILVASFAAAKMIGSYLRRYLKDKLSREYLGTLIKLIYYTIITAAVVSVLPMLGVRLSSLMVAGGIAGIMIGFASQSIVSNLISGLFLLIERPIKIGNEVDIKGVSGFVEDISILSTIIRTYDGLYVRIPNHDVFTSSITNYVGNVARRLEYVVGIRYSDDADKAIGIIMGIVEEHPLALKDPKPTAFVDTLGDNAVNIIVRIWAPATEWYDVKTVLLWKIKRTLEENGIEIAFPQRTVWFANEPQKRKLAPREGS